MKKPHPNTGNQHALKPPSQRKGTTLALRCRMQDKERWQEAAAAQGMSLNHWANEQLNKCADLDAETTTPERGVTTPPPKAKRPPSHNYEGGKN